MANTPTNCFLPQIVLAINDKWNEVFLQRLTPDDRKPFVNLIFYNDNDPRIMFIEYRIPAEKKNHSIYYSETSDQNIIITASFGYTYNGPVLCRDYRQNNVAFMEHWPANVAREKHIERINKLEGVRENLSPEYVSKMYHNIFSSLQRFV